MTRLVAIVPMRGDSERVVRKNLRACAGRPLYHHIVTTLARVPEIDELVVDTDCDEIASDVARCFPEVRIVRRAEALRGGHTSMNDVLGGTLRQVQADLVLQTHSTNPLLRPETIRRAIGDLRNAASDHDSLFSVTRRQVRLWTADAQPLNHDPAKLLRTQDLPAVLEENSCLYLFSPNVLASTGSRIGRRPLLLPIAPLEAVDIDDEADLLLAEALLERRSVTTMRHTLPTGVEWNETSGF